MNNAQKCRRVFSISDTVLETLRLVTNTHINPLGIAHGGNVLRWMVTAATMTAMRVARGPALLARLDNVFFINPIRLGMNAVITSWIEYIGHSSMELTILVEEEDPVAGARKLTTAAHMTYVKVGRDLKPRPVEACIEPRGDVEEELYRRALERKRNRGRRVPEERIEPVISDFFIENYVLVNPEDTVAYGAMHAGRLLRILDETAGILAMIYAKGVVVTAAVDATDFVAPILQGDIARIRAAITYVGKTSVEVGLVVSTFNPVSSAERVNAQSFFTLVHLSSEGRPAPVPRPEVLSNEEIVQKAIERRRKRLELFKFFRQEISKIKPPRRR